MIIYLNWPIQDDGNEGDQSNMGGHHWKPKHEHLRKVAASKEELLNNAELSDLGIIYTADDQKLRD